jgi:hypothetical protein
VRDPATSVPDPQVDHALQPALFRGWTAGKFAEPGWAYGKQGRMGKQRHVEHYGALAT